MGFEFLSFLKRHLNCIINLKILIEIPGIANVGGVICWVNDTKLVMTDLTSNETYFRSTLSIFFLFLSLAMSFPDGRMIYLYHQLESFTLEENRFNLSISSWEKFSNITLTY